MSSAARSAGSSAGQVPSAFVIRQLPAPQCEPPYDDESSERPRRAQPGDGVQGMLALSFGDEALPTATAATILRLVPSPGVGSGASRGAGVARARTRPTRRPESEGDDDLDLAKRKPVRTGRDQLPDPQPWARGFVQALTEVLGGFRPLGQLTERVVPAVVNQVIDCRAASAAAPARQRPVVRSVRVSEPAPGAAEVSATVRHGQRCRACLLYTSPSPRDRS